MADERPQDQVGSQPQHVVFAPASSSVRALSVSPHSVQAHESAQALHELIEHSKTLAERFERTLQEGRQEQTRVAQAIAPLQERLQLSAQMLQAFQTQITRVEMALAELKAQEKKAQVAEARAQQRLADVELRIESALERFSRKLEELSHNALTKVVEAGSAQSAVSYPASIRSDLDRLSGTMREVAERLAQISQIHVADEGRSSAPDSDAAAEIHVEAPLRFEKWASSG